MTLRRATESLPRKPRASGSGYTDRKTVVAEKLTETLLKGLIPPARGERYVYDAELTGSRTFVFVFRRHGVLRRFRIGAWPGWAVTAARAEAQGVRQR